MKSPMRSQQIKPNAGINPANAGAPFFRAELLLTVREATNHLGVRIQPVHRSAERKQIPRRGGSNIRFPRSDLEPFRATFKPEVGDGKT